jgi:hypothetical protein
MARLEALEVTFDRNRQRRLCVGHATDHHREHLALSHWIERQTGWSIKKFARTARRHRIVQIKAGNQTLTAADPLPGDLHQALTKIGSRLEH